MRFAFPAALLTALVLAGSAAADLPPPPTVVGASIGGSTAIRAAATITQPVRAFGDTVTASVLVVADTKSVDPASIRIVPDFSPYAAVGPPTERKSEHDRIFELTQTWTLRCLNASCVPDGQSDSLYRVFHFRPVVVKVLGANGKAAYGVSAAMPAFRVFSQISPPIAADLRTHGRIDWQFGGAPPPPSYRVSPALVFWLALALAGLCGAAGVALITRWTLRFRSPHTAATAGPSSSSLERALALFFWAGGRGDETLQRKALERVAAELPSDDTDLSEATREIAWSPEMPAAGEVEAISEKAGVVSHPHEERDE